MINSVFGFGLIKDFDIKTQADIVKPCLYVSNKNEWEKGYCSDYTGKEEYEVLGDLGFIEECDATFSQVEQKYNGLIMVDVKQLTKEQIHEKLTKAGFVYDEKFEEFMIDCLDEE